MDMQYVNSLYIGFKHQFRDMNTESLAPGIQNVSINTIDNDHRSQLCLSFVLGVYKHSAPSVQLRQIGSATFRLIKHFSATPTACSTSAAPYVKQRAFPSNIQGAQKTPMIN